MNTFEGAAVVNSSLVLQGRDYVAQKLTEAGLDPEKLVCGMIAGSGLGEYPNQHLAEDRVEIPFRDVFNQLGIAEHSGKVSGHARKLIIGSLKNGPADKLVVVQSGREHPYEDISPRRATFWLRLMQAFGVQNLITSNAAGIVTPDTLDIPALMMVMGDIDLDENYNPLLGSNDEDWGPRFPHMGDMYPADTRALAAKIADNAGVDLKQGILLRTKGPHYESRTIVYHCRGLLKNLFETAAAQTNETDFVGKPVGVVGMSTTYELRVAQHASQANRYPAFRQHRLALSVATNYAAGLGKDGPDTFPAHTEVEANARLVEERFGKLVRAIMLAIITQ